MHPLFVIGHILLHQYLSAAIIVNPASLHGTHSLVFSIFNGQFLFILRFFGKVILVFIVGGIIGKLLHLDKMYNS
jgi:hypothetical protein